MNHVLRIVQKFSPSLKNAPFSILCWTRRGFHVSTMKFKYYPHNHPYILKHNDINMYTDGGIDQRELELTSSEQAATSKSSDATVVKSFTVKDSQSAVRKCLKACSAEMTQSVFFYNETNPHIGLLNNCKQTLYDYFQMVGPVSGSWMKILLKDCDLVALLSYHIIEAQESRKSGAQKPVDDGNSGSKSPNTATATTEESVSIGTLAAIIEKLSNKKDVSSCKYKNTTTKNLIQFQRKKLTATELAILEVLAQYAYYEYEVV